MLCLTLLTISQQTLTPRIRFGDEATGAVLTATCTGKTPSFLTVNPQ